ncbi:hypothetical protein PHLCEN_2v8369 [Hermanssonia centrifuga]|uniref:WW domain-containing protein n=1 Tax=Hermanssonia centrifuga TaxID=98765 RepID=A0A2R6NTY5_9APHY|nr:hypothetical protein PHLCEN_2v8369 [Hermanssonia centrifuga]
MTSQFLAPGVDGHPRFGDATDMHRRRARSSSPSRSRSPSSIEAPYIEAATPSSSRPPSADSFRCPRPTHPTTVRTPSPAFTGQITPQSFKPPRRPSPSPSIRSSHTPIPRITDEPPTPNTATPAGHIAPPAVHNSPCISPSLCPESPMGFENFKYERTKLLPEDPYNAAYIQKINPLSFQFIRPIILPEGWIRCVSPEGNIYYYNKAERSYTDSPIDEEETANDIATSVAYIRSQLNRLKQSSDQFPSDVEITVHTIRSSKTDVICHYYLASWTYKSIFWLEEVDVGLVTGYVRHAVSEAHLGISAESQFWKHVELFSVDRTITLELLENLRDRVNWGYADTLSSETSTFPFDDNLSEKISRCTGKLKAGENNDYNTSALARYMHVLMREAFMNFHGETIARLNRDESVHHSPGDKRRTYLFRFLSHLLFAMPSLYLKELEKVWVDNTVAYHPWRRFMGEMKTDWENSITPATVLLSANVGFLAIQSIDNPPGSEQRSVAQLTAYVSALLSLFNYIAVQILARQHRHYLFETADRALRFIMNREASLGLEIMAVTVSLPTGLFIWSMLAFLAAIIFVLYHHTTLATRAVLAVVLGFLFLMTAILLYLEGMNRNDPYTVTRLFHHLKESIRSRLSVLKFPWITANLSQGGRQRGHSLAGPDIMEDDAQSISKPEMTSGWFFLPQTPRPPEALGLPTISPQTSTPNMSQIR